MTDDPPTEQAFRPDRGTVEWCREAMREAWSLMLTLRGVEAMFDEMLRECDPPPEQAFRPDVAITCADCSACFVGEWHDALRFALEHYRVIIDPNPPPGTVATATEYDRCTFGP